MTRNSLRAPLLGIGLLTLAIGVTALARPDQVQDPAQLPATRDMVARYSLMPRGDVDGLTLSDGTRVHLPPHLGTWLVFAVQPGDAVTALGPMLLGLPLVAAVSVTDAAAGRTVVDTGPPPPPHERGAAAGDELSAQDKVQLVLHGPRGEVNGAMLEDGTQLHLPLSEAARLAGLLTPGRTVIARGPGLSTVLGTVIEVRRIGPSQDQSTGVAASPPHRPESHRPLPVNGSLSPLDRRYDGCTTSTTRYRRVAGRHDRRTTWRQQPFPLVPAAG